MARKIRDRQDALACLKALDASGMTLTPWARAHGVDARSLHCWRLNLEARRDTSRIVELVPESPPPRPPARYILRVDDVEFEVDDPFHEETLARLLDLVAPC